MSASDYEDRIRASWYGQIAATLMGFAFEHRAAAVAVVNAIPDRFTGIPIDDDWYNENAGAVVGAMKGTKGLPSWVIDRLGDRITGDELGGVKLTPPVDEGLTVLSRRTAAIGRQFLAANQGTVTADAVSIRVQQPETQAAELFKLGDLMQYWSPDWTLLRAGVGGAAGGMSGIRGITHLEGDILATYPRDEVRGVVLMRRAMLSATPRLRVDVGADGGRAWTLDIHVDNQRPVTRMVQAKSSDREWQTVEVDLKPFAGQTVTIRLIQRVLLGPEYAPGNAYWRNLRVE